MKQFAVSFKEGKRIRWVRDLSDKRRAAVFKSREAAQKVADHVSNGSVIDLTGDINIALIQNAS